MQSYLEIKYNLMSMIDDGGEAGERGKGEKGFDSEMIFWL